MYMDRVPTYKCLCIWISWHERKKTLKAIEKSKRARKSAPVSQQVPAENPILKVVEDLCGHLCILAEMSVC